jgi:pentafunctional AROM polypeptide
MPCSGKSTLGRRIAKELNYLFVDLDDEITSEIHGSSIKEYINQNGWQMFRSLEVRVFQRVVQKVSSFGNHVLISCGGGCIESAEVRDELCEQPYVIYVNRDINDIKEDYLTGEIDTRPYMDLDKKLEDRKVYYRQCSKYEFCLLKNDRDWKTNEGNLLCFIKRIVDKKRQLLVSDDSFFICLTYKNLLNVARDKFASVISGCEAIELRVDLLESYDTDFIGQQIAYIRKCTSLPIIYTVRSQTSYGTFNPNEVAIFELLNYGVRFGCEFIDMEANWSDKIKKDWLNTIKNKHPWIIASLHIKLSVFEFDRVIHQCTKNGQIDVVKIAIDIDNQTLVSEDVLSIFVQLKEFFKQSKGPKTILVAMGDQGKLTRVLNRFMTPVTHELLELPAAKGQLTVKQIQEARFLLGIINAKQYYIFGTPVQHSLSPYIHQTGFDHFYLPYKYEICETNDVSLVQNIMKQLNFGGASITIPLKQDIYTLLVSDTNNTVSDSAKKIGAVNTVSKLENGHFYGDNTDWKAIYKLITENMSTEGSALIIGAGGTARAALYALNQIERIQLVYLYNPRHPEKTIDLARTYNNQNILSVTSDDVNTLRNIYIVINTLPSSIHFTLDHLFFEKNSLSEHGSILFDTNYMPYQTAIIKQAQQYNWNIIYGIDMLIEQGLEQFQIWTGKAIAVAPIIEETVRKTYHRIIDQHE